MPPRELPGFYFDEAKNRYFPLSMKPKPVEAYPGASSASENAATSASTRPVVPAKRSRTGSSTTRSTDRVVESVSVCVRPRNTTPASRLQSVLRAYPAPLRRREVHSLDMGHLAQTSSCLTLCPAESPLGAPITAVHASTDADTGGVTLVTGNANGLVNSTTVSTKQFTAPETSGQDIQDAWTFECAMNLSSPVLKVQGVDDRWMVTSYTGETFTMFFKVIQSDQGIMVAYNRLPDVWTSDLHGKRLCLGLHGRASFIPDIERTDLKLNHHITGSDVLSLYQENHLLYTGLRSSSLLRFDLRTPRSPKPPAPILTTSSSITTLNRIRQHELLVASMDGSLDIYDTRFTKPDPTKMRTEPVMSFRGHVNAYKHNLPVALTPSHDILFASGLDGRLRAWSTRTGQSLSASTVATPVFNTASDSISQYTRAHALDINPFDTRFTEPLSALDVLEVDGRTYLLGAAGNRVLRWNLGRRAGLL